MRILSLLLALMLAIPCATASEPDVLTAVFFGEEAADAILLYEGEYAILIDAGLKKYGERILSYMRDAGVGDLDLFIVTHFDKDHVGGAEKILEGVPVERILAPDYEGDSKRYTGFVDAARANGIAIERVSDGLTLSIGDMELSVDAAAYPYEQENDLSLVTRMQYGSRSFLFAGDVENDRLSELLTEGVEKADVLKIPHHGRIENLSEEFLRTVSPDYAIITSSEKEPEDASLVGLCAAFGVNVYLTRTGNVILTCDGDAIEILQLTGMP